MILVIDNYDFFTYNLVQYLGELGGEPEVVHNDAITAGEALDRAPAGILLGPGPGRPAEAGISREVIERAAGRVPILGVCLGHQCIGEVFGGRIVPARRLMHGKTSSIDHDGVGILNGLPRPFTATRYHSLVIESESFPDPVLEVTARSEDGEIMALRHRRHPIWGVQFHPESIMTEGGMRIMGRFLALTRDADLRSRPAVGAIGEGSGP